ncbi:MAG TPA: cytochrome P450 [Gammaproteobacteria bacterium]|nr:cytochrome P450 [Gammaproteobacteria bacterium]
MAAELAPLVGLRHPPGPRGLPYFGCLNGLLRNPMRFWSRIANRYGGIARVPLMKGHVAYLVSDPGLLYELLITNRNKYRKNIRYRAAVELFGHGLLLNEGDAWKRQRLMSQPAFKPEYIGQQMPWMAELTAKFLAGWQPDAALHRIRNVDEDFLDLSQLLAGYYLMGPGFEPIADRFCRAAIAVKDSWPLPPRNVWQLLRRRGDGWTDALAAAVRDIDVCVHEYLTAQRASDFADAGFTKLLVDASRAQGDEWNDKALRDQLLTVFFAGHETTASSLSWIHYLLDRHPEARRKLRDEVDTVLGGRAPTMADLDRLVYTEQVVNEALRLYSPIHSLSRVALEDDTIGGYHVPKGTTIYVSLYATHRLPSLWPDPDRFDPERFTAENVERRPRFAFIPFAAGHRNCVGASLGVVELKIAVAMIAQRYELTVAPGHRVEGAAGTTMHPRYGMKMRIRAL